MADILHRITIEAPPERVYEAVTTAEGLKSWWTRSCDAKPEEGSVARFGFDNGTVTFRMRIDELSPAKRVAWSCVGDVDEWKGTKLAFDLTPTDAGGTDLRFAHRDWRSTEGAYAHCNTTWGDLMHRLKSYAEGRPTEPRFGG